MTVQSVRSVPPSVAAAPSGVQATTGAARPPARPTQPRVLQSARAPGQMAFVFPR